MSAGPLLLSAAASALLLAAPLSAQDAGFDGTYRHDPAAGDDMEEVVDEGVDLVRSWLKRRFARGRIEETNVPYEWIRIEPGEDSVRVVTDQWDLTVPFEGTLEDWERAEDDFIDVTAEWVAEGGALRMRFESAEGARTNVFRLEPDGRTLTMLVVLTSDELGGPLEYEQVYRAGSPGS